MLTLKLAGRHTTELTLSVLIMNQVYVFTEPRGYSGVLWVYSRVVLQIHVSFMYFKLL